MTIDTDKLSALLEKCTPLPWGDDHDACLIGAYDDGPDAIYVGECDRKQDVAAIVAVMNAAPELIARVKELEAGNDQAKMTLSMLTQKLGAL